MRPCDCCGNPSPTLLVLDNGDDEPWRVCAACIDEDAAPRELAAERLEAS